MKAPSLGGNNLKGWPVFFYESVVHPDYSFTQAPDLAHLVAYEGVGAAPLDTSIIFQIADGQDLINEENFWLKVSGDGKGEGCVE